LRSLVHMIGIAGRVTERLLVFLWADPGHAAGAAGTAISGTGKMARKKETNTAPAQYTLQG